MDDANPFSGFQEEGDDQFQKEMELIEKEAQFDEVDEENIKQQLENDAEIPGHEIPAKWREKKTKQYCWCVYLYKRHWNQLICYDSWSNTTTPVTLAFCICERLK